MIKGKTLVWLIATFWAALALSLWLSVLSASNPAVAIAEPLQTEVEPNVLVSGTQQPARLSVHNATAEDLGRLGEAVRAFAKADLELPALDIWFHSDLGLCGEHNGVFRANPESWQIRICSSDIESVYEHELAHAWVAANVDDTQKSAFMDLRDLENWADRDVPWNRRGTEWAAVVVQQGLSGLPLAPALSDEAKSRLESFELLTGRVAPVLVQWITDRDVPCSDRPTGLSRPIADVTGRTCASEWSGATGLAKNGLVANVAAPSRFCRVRGPVDWEPRSTPDYPINLPAESPDGHPPQWMVIGAPALLKGSLGSYPTMPCRPPSAALLQSVSQGLSDGLAIEDAVLVEVVHDRPSQRFMPSHFVAGFISGAQPSRVEGLWAIGITGDGSITALNEAAREFTNWGAAARSGSTADTARIDALAYPEAREALDCLQSETPGR